MVQTDISNTLFQLAADFVNNTSRHIFLTGKAGTGKTTFLKYIKENTRKNTVVIAPTGVAAINAGGVTMHSFFQLPFGPYMPSGSSGFGSGIEGVSDKHSLFKNIRFNADKRALLQELELLVIDEVSMLRADMLDAIDSILRQFRKKPNLAFGGVQVLYIGDLYQLPPVVANNEWDILSPYYESPFFFSAQVIAQAPPLYIELKKIYRQNEQVFIDVLNRVRNNQVTDADFTLLNERYRPGFTPGQDEKYVTLSTHNRKTDAINATELDKLPGKTMVFDGIIEGEFSDKALPTDMKLQLKEGAQVMFIKNDSGTGRKFFNGKLATIKSISADEIIVTANNEEELKVEKETWRNVRYVYDKETDSIEEDELGSFKQYPLRLAWAVTIHKSQGLTFDRAIIDAGASFAPGQVYVALSRCTSLQGMVLLSKLYPSAIATDKRVIAFAQKEAEAETLQQLLQQEQRQYWANTLVSQFNYDKVIAAMEQFTGLLPGKKLPDPAAAALLAKLLNTKALEQGLVADKFSLQLQQLLTEMLQSGDSAIVDERVLKAIHYFVKVIGEELLLPLQAHITVIQPIARLKKYAREVLGIETLLLQQVQKLLQSRYGNTVFCKDPAPFLKYTTSVVSTDSDTPGTAPDKKKNVKGSSHAESLGLFRKGKSIAQIAAIRRLTEGTVANHLASFVRTGEVQVLDLLPEEKLKIILPVVKEVGGVTVTPIKQVLGDDYSYEDIRIVMNHWQRLQQLNVNP